MVVAMFTSKILFSASASTNSFMQNFLPTFWVNFLGLYYFSETYNHLWTNKSVPFLQYIIIISRTLVSDNTIYRHELKLWSLLSWSGYVLTCRWQEITTGTVNIQPQKAWKLIGATNHWVLEQLTWPLVQFINWR